MGRILPCVDLTVPTAWRARLRLARMPPGRRDKRCHITPYRVDHVIPSYLLHSFADKGRDTDGDSRFDTLDVAVGLDVQKTGTYTVTGDLYSNTDGPLPGASRPSLSPQPASTPPPSRSMARISASIVRTAVFPAIPAIYNAPATSLIYLPTPTRPRLRLHRLPTRDAELPQLQRCGVDTDATQVHLLRFTAGVTSLPRVYSLSPR